MRKQQIIILSLFLFSLFLSKDNGIRAQNQIYEVKFETKHEDDILDAVYSQMVIDEKPQIFTRLKVFKNKVKFYEVGKLVNELDYSYRRPVISKSGNYIGIYSIIERAETYIIKAKFSVYNQKGELIWENEYNVGIDKSGGNWLISNKDGSAINLLGDDGILEIYDAAGVIKKKIDLFDDDYWSYKRSYGADYSDNGKYFAIAYERECCPSYNSEKLYDNLYLIFYNDLGNELWRKALREPNLINLEFCKQSDLVKVITKNFEDKIIGYYLYDMSGNLVKYCKMPAKGPTGPICRLSQDQRFYVIANADTLVMIDLIKNDILIDLKLPWANNLIEKKLKRIIHDIDFIENESLNAIIITSAETYYQSGYYKNPELHIINFDGDTVYREQFLGEKKYTEEKVDLKVLENGKLLVLNFGKDSKYLKACY